MSNYLDGLGFGLSASLWLLGALTPLVVAAIVLGSLYGPLSALVESIRWRLWSRVNAYRMRREAAYVTTTEE